MKSDVVRVGIADYKLCSSPQKITTLGLGSCLGVVIYEPSSGICGMAHVMLPDSRRITNNTERKKFVDTCIQDMYDELIKKPVHKERLVAKIAGGARMFSHHSENDFFNIGSQNYLAVCKILAKCKVRIVAEDIGGTCSRTIVFDPETEEMLIRGVNKSEIQEHVI